MLSNKKIPFLSILLVVFIVTAFFIGINQTGNVTDSRDDKKKKVVKKYFKPTRKTFSSKKIISARAIPVPKKKVLEDNEYYTEDFAPKGAFSSVWAYDKSHVYAAGMDGMLIKYNGEKALKYKLKYKDWIYKVAGRSPEEIYAACQDGVVLKYDGAKWKKFHQFPEKVRLSAIWLPKEKGSKAVFIGGDNGLIYRYDGSKWTKMDTKTKSRIWSLWGSGSNNVYAAFHGSGNVLHYDGNKWNKEEVPGAEHHCICSIFGFSDKDFYLGCDTGLLIHYSEGKFQPLKISALDSTDYIKSISGTSPSDLYLLGYSGKIFHWDGRVATLAGKQSINRRFHEIYAIDRENVFAVGDGGVIKYYRSLD